MGVVLGIDYGMSETKVSYVDENGKLKHICSSYGTETTPSAVYLSPDDVYYVGRAAFEEGTYDPENLVINSKCRLGYNDYTFDVGNKSYTASDILTTILKRVVRDAEEQLDGVPIDGAVLSCPAYFNDPARRSLQEAAESVVLSNGQELAFKGLVDDPVATVISYCEEILPSHSEGIDKTFLVYDLGCSFDATVVRVKFSRDEKKIYILGTGGDHQFGVPNWVHIVKGFIIDRSCAEMGVDPGDMWADPDMRPWLQETAEKVLHVLIRRNSTVVTVGYDGERVKVEITRDDLFDGIEPYIGIAISNVDYALNESHRTIYDIDEILVVGGGARLPYVYESLTMEYGRPIVVLDSLHVVADGAALVGASIICDVNVDRIGNGDEEKEITISDIQGMMMGLPISSFKAYYIGVGDSPAYYRMIDEYVPLPAQHSELFMTEKDDQTEFVIRIYEAWGEPGTEDGEAYEVYEPLSVPLDPGLPKGSLVQVSFKVGEDGIVEVKVTDTTHGIITTVHPMRKHLNDSDSLDDLSLFDIR